ncbi:MAG: DEAD/DEAH box helicase [Patescibacteria group bacterium]|nr:DEAD/DEAH box helicase [Patescibacteria group bacterium]
MYNRNRGHRGRFDSHSRGSKRKISQFRDISKFINPISDVRIEEKYIPTHTFSGLSIEESLKKNILAVGYKTLTPIQDQAIIPALENKDVVGIANTGTGKTAAFLIPLINKVIKDKNQNVIILAPTRELALQINQEFVKLGRGLGIFSVCTVGGMPIYRQICDLRRKHNFIIGTPGRVKDLIERKCIDLTRFCSIVLDESDRMLDMGFVQDMKMIMSSMPVNRQTLFLSATLSPEVQRIIKDFLKDPVQISVKSRDTSGNIDQNVVYIKNKQKIDVLHELLQNPELKKVLIFGTTKHGVERLSEALTSRGFKSDSIHGNKNHNQRQRALRSFKDDSVKILVATDVAARGLDIPDVSHVINYELPATYADYIHRIGRTGRGGKVGKALTLVE